MKTLNIFLAIAMAVSTFSISSAQTKTELQKETVKVWGNCGMCQARIEKSAKEAGATSASWNDETKMLSVSFAPSKTSLKAIEEKVASVGHDTQNFSGDNQAYDKLHGCCKYDRKTTNEPAVASCCKASGEKPDCCDKDMTCCSKN